MNEDGKIKYLSVDALTQPMHVCEGLGPYGEEKDEII
jgi:hypothetical protein